MRMILLLALMLPPLAAANEYSVSNINVYDGDTVKATVAVFPNMQYAGSIRIRGIDSPEIRTKSACEKEKGRKAREALSVLLHAADDVVIANVANGKYAGRVIADMHVDGLSVADYMIKYGYAKPYDGGHRDRNWCGG